jgi:hypothetical protein
MSAKYVIRWKSKVNGRAGRGTKEFSREEGQRLVGELNEEYPDIQHELIVPPPPQPEQGSETAPESETEKQPAAAHAGNYE